jgi:sugar fermentation stimulation protein A
MAQVEQGERGVLFFVVNHTGIETVRPADHIDARYGQLLREACDAGVEVLAYRASLASAEGDPTGLLTLTEPVPVILEV